MIALEIRSRDNPCFEGELAKVYKVNVERAKSNTFPATG